MTFINTSCKNLCAILMVAAVMSLASCGSSKRTVRGDRGRVENIKNGSKGDKTVANGSNKATDLGYPQVDVSSYGKPVADLLKEAYSWKGVKYTWGGNSREEGVDCSGFVVQVFKRSMNISLPRVSRDQYAWCTPVEREDLVPGDLLFFTNKKGNTRVTHVGLYVGNGRMIHSSMSRKCVDDCDLSSKYFQDMFVGAGRVDKYYAMIDTKASKKAKKEKPAKEDKKPAPKVIDTKPSTEVMVAKVPAKIVDIETVTQPVSTSTAAATPAVTEIVEIKEVPVVEVIEIVETPAKTETPAPAKVETPAPTKVHSAAHQSSTSTTTPEVNLSDLRKQVLSDLPDD